MEIAKKTNLDWAPCFADPSRGVAFFDGITIESDRITDPRRDRVLPILKEEQIFMCRQMRHLLKPGALVLDVGTGSGVFAIWAAKHGCRVVAVDISERARRVARQNIKTNAQSHDIRLSEPGGRLSKEGADQLEPGEISLLKLAFNGGFVRKLSGAFDLVFLAPPYNPTCEKIFPAQHASAGISGQVCFEDQIELVPGVLKEGGRCIGNQMTPSDGAESIYAIRKIQNSFSKQSQDCTIRYAHILDSPGETFDVEEFLKGMYGSFINGFANEFPTSPNPEYVEETYFKRAKKDAADKAGCDRPQYALIYYEAEKKAGEPTVCLLNERYKVPDVDWQDRIQLHRDIVEHTSDPSLIPSHALFMQRGPVSDFPLTGEDEQEKSEWKRSPLYIADRWVSRRGLLGNGSSSSDGSSPFDVMLVDTAPMHREVMTPLQLRQECKAWLPKGDDEDEKEVRKELFERLLIEWQRNTLAQQEEAVGPFLHPHFIKANNPKKWSDIQCTTLTSDKFEESRETAEERLRDDIHQRIQRARRKQEGSGVPEGVTIEAGEGFSYSELSTLRVPNTSRNNADYVSKMRARIEEADFPQGKGKKEKVKTDLELCHEVMHERVHRIAQEAIGRELAWSTLIGIPLSMAYSEGEADKSKVPDSYRGGVWIFAGGCSRDWTLEHEETLFDFARLLWMLYNGKYNVEAAKISSVTAKHQAATVSGHEAGAQMTLVDMALPLAGHTMTEYARKLIRGSLRYAHLFLNETEASVPSNWLPWKEDAGKDVNEWVKRSLATGWEVAVAREARGISFEEMSENEDVWDCLLNLNVEEQAQFHNDLGQAKFRPPSKSEGADIVDQTMSWNVLRWFLAASSNAFKWSAPNIAEHESWGSGEKMSVLKKWSANLNSFSQVKVSLEESSKSSKQNIVLLSVLNGCKKPVPKNYHTKSSGTLGALDSIARSIGCKSCARPLTRKELEKRLPREDHGFIVTLELPTFVFSN